MEKNTHYFWAIRLSDDAKKTMHAELEKIKDSFPFKRWVHEFDYHITLTFLGSVEEQNLDLTVSLVGNAVKDVKAFPLLLQGLDVFGNKEAPRIFWASIRQERQLFLLQSLVFKACFQAGFSLESRPYLPHITLARNWNGTKFEREWLEKYNPFIRKPIFFKADEVVLYKTNLEKAPKYEPIATFSLGVE
jgi:RNA 2',3'-cyclic 3'-phosphodiesterase